MVVVDSTRAERARPVARSALFRAATDAGSAVPSRPREASCPPAAREGDAVGPEAVVSPEEPVVQADIAVRPVSAAAAASARPVRRTEMIVVGPGPTPVPPFLRANPVSAP